MSITLSPQMEERILKLREDGQYSDASAVLNDALSLLETKQRQLTRLRDRVQVAIDEADREELDDWTPDLSNRILREAEEMYARGERPDPDDAF